MSVHCLALFVTIVPLYTVKNDVWFWHRVRGYCGKRAFFLAFFPDNCHNSHAIASKPHTIFTVYLWNVAWLSWIACGTFTSQREWCLHDVIEQGIAKALHPTHSIILCLHKMWVLSMGLIFATNWWCWLFSSRTRLSRSLVSYSFIMNCTYVLVESVYHGTTRTSTYTFIQCIYFIRICFVHF